MSKKIISVDLGTGNSAVAVMEGGKPTIIINSEGKRTTPSIVAYTKEGERKVGDSAKRQAITNPLNTVFSIKRFMGETYEQVIEEVKRVPYKVIKDSNGYPKVDIDGKLYSPEEISSAVLQNLKKSAEDYLGEEVTDAVITVPAYFSDSQRLATKNAGEIAGLNVRRIINEPTAAALAYGLDKQDNDSKIVVFDLGQGTFDVSILELGDGVFEVLSTNGDTHLGGDDFDQCIIDWVAEEFLKDYPKIDIRKDSMALQRLKEAAEKAKIELSNQTSTEINLPYITVVDGMPVHLVKTISRAKFESLTESLVNRTLEPCKKAMADAKLSTSDINEVILVGGSTRIPKVQEVVKNYFGKEPNKSVNPDEVVALGAAVQASILAGEKTDVLLLDVTPLNLGIETMGGVMTNLIEANTTIPIKKSQIFSTAEDNQPAVTISICQGNRPMAKDNKQIGVFMLDGIAPAARGIPQIEVTFDIDSNGILSVSATDKGTGKEQHITIQSKGSLSDSDIERMKKEAEEHAEEDNKRKEKADKINQADAFVFQTEKNLKDLDDKLTEEQKSSISGPLTALKDVLKEEDVERVEACRKDLEEAWHKVSETMYGNSSATGSTGNPFGGTDNPFGDNNPFAGN